MKIPKEVTNWPGEGKSAGFGWWLIVFALMFAVSGNPSIAQTPSPFRRVDQFGYWPGAAKIAVITDPQAGFNTLAPYFPAIRSNFVVWWTT